MWCIQLDVAQYTAFAVPKVAGRLYEFVAISNAVSHCYNVCFCSLLCYLSCQFLCRPNISDIPVTETQTDTEMIDISKTHTEKII